MLNLSEVFYSLQGEGPCTGHPAIFVRTAGCNLNCGQERGAEWKCDTWNVMRNTHIKVSPEDLFPKYIEPLYKYPSRIVFTGGEPLLQAADLAAAIEQIINNDKMLYAAENIDLETNGTIYSEDVYKQVGGIVSVSPKLANSHIPLEKRFKEDVLGNIFKKNVNYYPILKLVVAAVADVTEIRERYIPFLRQVYPIDWNMHLYLMPAMEDVPDSQGIKQFVWTVCEELHVPMSLRAQIETFGRKTGV